MKEGDNVRLWQMRIKTAIEQVVLYPSVTNKQWDHKKILGSGPWVPDCYKIQNSELFCGIQTFSGPFFNFSGVLVVIFIQIVKKRVQNVENDRKSVKMVENR